MSWLGRVDDGETVSVSNRFGNVRVRFGGFEGVVDVVATLQHFAEEGPPLALRAAESDDGATVEVGFQPSTGDAWSTRRSPEQKKRADLVVFVPAGASLVAETENGLLEIRGVRGDVRGTTASGEIIAHAIQGDLHFRTGEGKIVVNLFPRESASEQSIVSAGGDIDVHLDEDVDLDVRVETAGLISTDFSLHIDPAELESGRKRGVAAIGKARTVLRVESENGHVRLVRRPLARKARIRGSS